MTTDKQGRIEKFLEGLSREELLMLVEHIAKCLRQAEEYKSQTLYGIERGNLPEAASIEPLKVRVQAGIPEAIRQVMHELPHLSREDLDELEQAIEEGKLPVHREGVFNEGN